MSIKEFVRERNEAFLSLDKEKILRFLEKYNVQSTPVDEETFWAGVHKVIFHIKSSTDEQKEISRRWLLSNGFSTDVTFIEENNLEVKLHKLN
jgi:hypothetical protein